MIELTEEQVYQLIDALDNPEEVKLYIALSLLKYKLNKMDREKE